MKEIIVSTMTIYIIYIMLYVHVFAEIKGLGGKPAAAAAEGEGGDAIIRSSCLSRQKTTTFEVQGQWSTAATSITWSLLMILVGCLNVTPKKCMFLKAINMIIATHNNFFT